MRITVCGSMSDCKAGIHYCPNCDRTIDFAVHQQALREAQEEVKQVRQELAEQCLLKATFQQRAQALEARVRCCEADNVMLIESRDLHRQRADRLQEEVEQWKAKALDLEGRIANALL